MKKLFISHALFSSLCALQAYTSQFVALIMFALLMCDDRISMQARRREIIQGLKVLPGKSRPERHGSINQILITEEVRMQRDGRLAHANCLGSRGFAI